MEPKDKQQAQAYVDDIFEIIPKGSFGLVDFEKARCVYADEEHMREIIIDQMTNYLVKVGFIGKKNPLLWEKMTILVYNTELGHKGLFLTNKKASIYKHWEKFLHASHSIIHSAYFSKHKNVIYILLPTTNFKANSSQSSRIGLFHTCRFRLAGNGKTIESHHIDLQSPRPSDQPPAI